LPVIGVIIIFKQQINIELMGAINNMCTFIIYCFNKQCKYTNLHISCNCKKVVGIANLTKTGNRKSCRSLTEKHISQYFYLIAENFIF